MAYGYIEIRSAAPIFYLNNGSGQFQPLDPDETFRDLVDWDGRYQVPADVNGDGVVDYVFPHRVVGPDDQYGTDDDSTRFLTLLNTTPAGPGRCRPRVAAVGTLPARTLNVGAGAVVVPLAAAVPERGDLPGIFICAGRRWRQPVRVAGHAHRGGRRRGHDNRDGERCGQLPRHAAVQDNGAAGADAWSNDATHTGSHLSRLRRGCDARVQLHPGAVTAAPYADVRSCRRIGLRSGQHCRVSGRSDRLPDPVS